jgi:hypothetical protein
VRRRLACYAHQAPTSSRHHQRTQPSQEPRVWRRLPYLRSLGGGGFHAPALSRAWLLWKPPHPATCVCVCVCVCMGTPRACALAHMATVYAAASCHTGTHTNRQTHTYIHTYIYICIDVCMAVDATASCRGLVFSLRV